MYSPIRSLNAGGTLPSESSGIARPYADASKQQQAQREQQYLKQPEDEAQKRKTKLEQLCRHGCGDQAMDQRSDNLTRHEKPVDHFHCTQCDSVFTTGRLNKKHQDGGDEFQYVSRLSWQSTQRPGPESQPTASATSVSSSAGNQLSASSGVSKSCRADSTKPPQAARVAERLGIDLSDSRLPRLLLELVYHGGLVLIEPSAHESAALSAHLKAFREYD